MTSPYFKPPPRGEDLPYSDGDKLESERHVKQNALLVDALTSEWAHRADFYVGTDMFVYFSETQAKKNDFRGPDIFVVLGTTRKERKSWVVWEEDSRTPDVIIEVLSDTTAHVDRGEKKRIYSKLLTVPEYYLYDPFTLVLEGFELDRLTREYQPRALDAHGRLFSNQLGMFLGVAQTSYQGLEAPMLRLFRPNGELVPFEAERAAALAREARRLLGEKEKLADEKEKLARENEELRAKLARLEREAKKR